MAGVQELLLHPLEGEEEIDEDPETLDEDTLYRSSSAFDREIHRRHHHDNDHGAFDPDVFIPVFSPADPSTFYRRSHQIPSDSDSESDYLDDQVSLSLDLSDRCSPQPHHHDGDGGGDAREVDPFPDVPDPFGFGVYDGEEEMGSDYLELGLGLGVLGLGLEKQQDDEGGDAGENSEVGSDWDGDGFSLCRRSAVASELTGGETSRSRDGEGLRIVGFGSDSDSDDEDQITDDLGLRLCWDCLHIDEDRRDPNEEFEWEEVDGRVDEREVLTMVMDPNEDRSIVREETHVDVELTEEEEEGEEEEEEEEEEDEEDEEEETVRNIEWEVLLTVNNLERNTLSEHEDAESYLGDDHEDYVYTSEYEILFGQFADQDGFIKGSPPAAKSVVMSLPSVVLTQEDLANNNTLCAVCKDEISLEESAKQLPCSHHYHGECILPWLGIRNTCPVCRYELPTDDPGYECWRVRRAGSGGTAQEARVWYNFEMFPEE